MDKDWLALWGNKPPNCKNFTASEFPVVFQRNINRTLFGYRLRSINCIRTIQGWSCTVCFVVEKIVMDENNLYRIYDRIPESDMPEILETLAK